MTSNKRDDQRLALAEVTCLIDHLERQSTGLRDGTTYAAMAPERRADELVMLDATLTRARQTLADLARAVPDPDSIVAPDGTTPPERRTRNLTEYIRERRTRTDALMAKVKYLRAIVRDTKAPAPVRKQARHTLASAESELRAIHAEPADAELRPDDMCPDGIHLAASHGYVYTTERPRWPCAAWPGQLLALRPLDRLLFEPNPARREDALTRWQLTLYCGHTVVRAAHRSYPTYSGSGAMSRPCETCGVDPSFVVEEQSLGPFSPAADQPQSRPNRAALERRARQLRKELKNIDEQLRRQ